MNIFKKRLKKKKKVSGSSLSSRVQKNPARLEFFYQVQKYVQTQDRLRVRVESSSIYQVKFESNSSQLSWNYNTPIYETNN